MIVTDLQHVKGRVPMTKGMKKAVEFLKGTRISKPGDGRVEIDGERVFAFVQRYETIPTDTPKFEIHKKYIDIQYIGNGEEIIGWATVDRLNITEPYDSGKDICFGTVNKGSVTNIILNSGQLVVLYPEDAHAPKLAAGKSSAVFKIVVKVAASLD
jgi:YhcH/YjgK/YiaL family protein